MRMKSGSWVGFLILVGLGLLTSCSTKSSTSSGTGALFVTTQGDALVSPFSVDLRKGSITANGTGVATGVTPSAIVLTPSGDAAFVANRDSNDISRYTVKSDNTLLAVSGNTPAGVTPVSMAIDSAGHFLFVANRGSDGSLTPISGSPFSAGVGPLSPAVDHSGKFLYVADRQSNQVSGFSISSSTGILTALSTPSISTGVSPVWLAIHPGGQFLYVANNGAASISAYTINTTSGVLGVVGSSFTTGGQPSALALK